MHLCGECKEELAGPEPSDGFPFCAFTVAGGILGGIGAAATGGLLLVPAGLVAGAMTDVYRCAGCGAEQDGESPHYALMQVEDDGTGEMGFVSLHPSASPVRGAQGRRGRGPENPSAREREDPWDDPLLMADEGPFRQPPARGASSRYRYDEIADRLVPLGTGRADDEVEAEHESSMEPGLGPGEADLGLCADTTGVPHDGQAAFPGDAGTGEGWFPGEQGSEF